MKPFPHPVPGEFGIQLMLRVQKRTIFFCGQLISKFMIPPEPKYRKLSGDCTSCNKNATKMWLAICFSHFVYVSLMRYLNGGFSDWNIHIVRRFDLSDMKPVTVTNHGYCQNGNKRTSFLVLLHQRRLQIHRFVPRCDGHGGNRTRIRQTRRLTKHFKCLCTIRRRHR